MSRHLLRLPSTAALAALQLCLGAPATAQTTTTNCQAYANQLNCTSTQLPSAQQQYDQQAQQFSQAMARLGAALAQRRAMEAQQRAAWEAAATEQAKQAAQVARNNYDATTDALMRFAQDTFMPTASPVNQELYLDWQLLDGLEAQFDQKGENGARWKSYRRYAFTDTPQGGKILRMDETTEVFSKKQHVATAVTSGRYDPLSGVLIITRDGRPQYTTFPPAYESNVLAGTHAFATRMDGHGYDVTVPPGTFDFNMLALVVATIPGKLPASLRIWVVNQQGEVVPADIAITGTTTVQEPVGPVGGSCANGEARRQKRDAVVVRVTAGTFVQTATVLAAYPHLLFTEDIKCRIIPSATTR